MQANAEEKPVPELYSDAELTLSFDSHLKLDENLQDDDDVRLSDDDEVSEEEEEDFSFNCGEVSTSLITAEDAFVNGQIKPVIPRLDRDLLYSLHESLPAKPPVKKIFVETSGGEVTSSDGIVGPYCEWSGRKVVEAGGGGDQVCKKSNSTGFSKIWRFRERVDRSNSDGRDTYVFLNNNGGAAAKPAAKTKRKVKKSGKTKTAAPVSAHEVYLKSKAQGDERRRSYLPYRPELVGFFTNVNGGGLTKNIHPF